MITFEQFHEIAIKIRDDKKLDATQKEAVSFPACDPLFLVAGPGSGKTTVLTLRTLRFIFVDGIYPQSIVATTFTKKAAAELRSRILSWGELIKEEVKKQKLTQEQHTFLENIDINRIITGTLDSLAETIMRDFRMAGDPPPVVLDQFLADVRLARKGLFEGGRFKNKELEAYLKQIRGSYQARSLSTKKGFLRGLHDRFAQNQADLEAFARDDPGRQQATEAISCYRDSLRDDEALDFALLEEEFHSRLLDKRLAAFLDTIKVLLVDEYQDTNYLQEQIYFTIAQSIQGAITVVGDDDQSLYRFRGATVDLFRELPNRLKIVLGGKTAKTIHLRTNYRSSQQIVTFFSQFIKLDPAYLPARVLNKPEVLPHAGAELGLPVLGMFRDNREALAQDLAELIHAIFRGSGFEIILQNKKITIQKDPEGGDVGDCALLMSSPAEYSSGGGQRLPKLLQDGFSQYDDSIQLFNPRGEFYAEIDQVMTLCGLLLEAIDPHKKVEETAGNFPEEAVHQMHRWRDHARSFITTNPVPNRPHPLKDFINAWAVRRSQEPDRKWPQEALILDLCYKLVTWLPFFQDDPEGQVYLEVICRAIAQNATYSRYESKVLSNKESESIKEAYWNIFIPLATGVIELNEELIETFPRNRLSILSIHQAKGLEFPMVIVDVSSDFSSVHWTQEFKRFPHPKRIGETYKMEDEVRGFSPLKAFPLRPQIDRAFDDLVRNYFVAYSRAQIILLLVGLRNNHIPNVALGWRRDESWAWQDKLPWLTI